MITAEYKSGNLVVRIHDECYEKTTEQRLAHAGRIVSASYKRRQAEMNSACAISQGNEVSENWNG